MIFFGILFSTAAIGFFCWLLFMLAVFALPVVTGVTAGMWALTPTPDGQAQSPSASRRCCG